MIGAHLYRGGGVGFLSAYFTHTFQGDVIYNATNIPLHQCAKCLESKLETNKAQQLPTLNIVFSITFQKALFQQPGYYLWRTHPINVTYVGI